MKKSNYAIIFCLLFICACCNIRQRSNLAGPVVIPDTTREMKTAGFWTAKIKYPDEIILDAKGIDKFNRKVESELGLIINPLDAVSQYSGKTIKNDLRREIETFSEGVFYNADGKPAGKSFYGQIIENINLPQISDKLAARFGFLAHYDNQRLLPTDMPLTKEPGDLEFDELQNSSLDAGTPLVILHETKDGIWAYAQAPSSCGWFKKEKIAFCSQDDFKKILPKENLIIITSGKADIFLDEDLTKYYDHARMGARFASNGAETLQAFEIIIPSLKDEKFSAQRAYVRKRDANAGYLPYTPRNIIEQAFKLLNSPYGWGGANGEQDCSSYMQEVFATVGVNLPRNSSAQAKTGLPLADFKGGTNSSEKLKIIKEKAVAGATIFQMKGHVVLYLGTHKNIPYIIHDTHGWGQKINSENISWIVNRVIVSDLTLGDGSKKGSLLSRIINIRLIK